MKYTATPDTIAHYKRPEVKAIIQRISTDGTISKAGNGDFSEWYRYEDGKPRLINLSSDDDYGYVTRHFRTLYWTLNYFTPAAWSQRGENLGTPVETMGYTLGIDIDKGKDCDIHDPFVKKAVEDMAQFFCDELLKHQPKSTYSAFSGGGIYVYLHHKIWDKEFKNFTDDNRERELRILLKAFKLWIADKEQVFFQLHPEYKEKCKADKLTDAKRVFKSLFSIHRKHPYVVIPLDPHNIKIDFERAKLPLKDEVIKSAETWYSEWDEVNRFDFALGKYIPEAMRIQEGRESRSYGDIDVLPSAVKDIKLFPPCIMNIIRAEKMPVGEHRAIAFLSAFLGQIGWEEKDAYDFVKMIGKRLKADGTKHIFESWFKVMSCASCRKIREDIDTYPGQGFGDIGICTPGADCKDIKHPLQYVDEKSNASEKVDKIDNPYAPKYTWVKVEPPKYVWVPVKPESKTKWVPIEPEPKIKKVWR